MNRKKYSKIINPSKVLTKLKFTPQANSQDSAPFEHIVTSFLIKTLRLHGFHLGMSLNAMWAT